MDVVISSHGNGGLCVKLLKYVLHCSTLVHRSVFYTAKKKKTENSVLQGILPAMHFMLSQWVPKMKDAFMVHSIARQVCTIHTNRFNRIGGIIHIDND